MVVALRPVRLALLAFLCLVVAGLSGLGREAQAANWRDLTGRV